MREVSDTLETHNRALKVNLDPRTFGTFAEIGAGQEVARWFLRVGGAAGGVAKTISAYAMKFSDAIYGKGTRYVSRERLISMLDHEYELLVARLSKERGDETQFFVFADTVEARNYAGTNRCHGWLGTRFQTEPGGEPSDVRLHVNMRDSTNVAQQETVGILGVNLIYAGFYARETTDSMLETLFTDLSLDRLEIDVVELAGPAFAGADIERIGEQLVRKGLTRAVLFDRDGTLLDPSDVLRKRPLVVERGLFEDVRPIHKRILEEACEKLQQTLEPEREPIPLPELSIVPVEGRVAPDEQETHRRLGELLALGYPVLLTRFPEAYHLTGYLRRYTREPMRFVFGASTLVQILQHAQYSDLMGGVIEALGRLLADNVKLYLYPMRKQIFEQLTKTASPQARIATHDGEWLTAETIRLAPPVGLLYRYLLEVGWIEGLAPPEES